MDKHYVLTIFICILLFGCRTHQEPVVVDHVQVDTVRLYSHNTDSVFLHDSIYTLVKGDSVLVDRWHTLYKSHTKTDTLYQSKVDSVPVPYEVIKEVKYTPWYSKALAWIGSICLIFLFIVLIYKFKVNK